jgi:transmembrane sensor
MSASDDLDVSLLDRWLAGEASDGDRDAVAAWCAESPARERWLSAVQASLTPADAARVHTDASWAALQSRLHAPVAEVVAPTVVRDIATARRAPQFARRTVVRAAIGMAAALAVVVSLQLVPRDGTAGDVVLLAPSGVRPTSTLPDGSQVTLMPGSELRWAAGEFRRDVTLTGEAYFVVEHDARRPFTVRAGNALVRDLGTRFTVRAPDATRAAEVAVEDGIVALTDTAATRANASAELRAGQRARLRPDGGLERLPDAEDALAWVHGTLVFDDAPLGDVVATLSRWYGTMVSADAALRTRRVSARFDRQPLPSVVTALSLTLGATVQQRGDTVVLISIP